MREARAMHQIRIDSRALSEQHCKLDNRDDLIRKVKVNKKKACKHRIRRMTSPPLQTAAAAAAGRRCLWRRRRRRRQCPRQRHVFVINQQSKYLFRYSFSLEKKYFFYCNSLFARILLRCLSTYLFIILYTHSLFLYNLSKIPYTLYCWHLKSIELAENIWK